MSLGELKPEEKVNIAIGMTDVCVRVCADSARDRCLTIGEEQLVELVRERMNFGKQREQWV